MWYLEKDVVISAAHHLEKYQGKCLNIHGHNWNVTIYCRGNKLDKRGILIDFKQVKEQTMELDHQDLNKILPKGLNPTAENLAAYLCNSIPYCWKVLVEEQEGSRCIYTKKEK